LIELIENENSKEQKRLFSSLRNLKSLNELEDIRQIGREIKTAGSYTADKARKVAPYVKKGAKKVVNTLDRDKETPGFQWRKKRPLSVKPKDDFKYNRAQVAPNPLGSPHRRLGESAVDNEIANYINSYLKMLYTFFSSLIIRLSGQDKNRRYDRKYKQKIRNIIIEALIEYRNPRSIRKALSQLDRLNVEEMKRNKATNVSESTMQKVAYAVTLASVVSSVIMAMVSFIERTSKAKKSLERALRFNKVSQQLFDTIIIPQMEDIADAVIDRRITSRNELKIRFYRVIDNLSSKAPEMADILNTWK